MNTPRRLSLTLASLALIACACSSGGTPATSTGPGGGGGAAGAMPCDKLAPAVTQISGLTIASTEARPDDCTFTMNAAGDSSNGGLGGIIDIRQESTTPAEFDSIVGILVGTEGVDVPGVGDKARSSKDGSLLYAIHNGHVWAVQQELLGSTSDLPANAAKLMLALFQLV